MEVAKNYEPAKERMKRLGMDMVKIEKEVSFALQHMNKNQKLQECTENSKMAAIVNIANIGLTLNPAAREAYLLPRWSKGGMECCLEPSYIGLVKLLTDAGSIKSIVCNLVYSGDHFGIDIANNHSPVKHQPCLIKSQRGELLGAYALATLPDNNRQVEWMDKEDLYLIRERSETYKAFKDGKIKSCTWATDEGEMMRKTVIKRIYKYLPRTDRMHAIDAAIEVDNEDYAASDGQVNFIQSLLHSSSYDHDYRANIESELNTLSAIRASELINDLQQNQLDPVTQGGNYNQGDIKKHLSQLS